MASAKGKVVVSAEIPEKLRDELDQRAEEEQRRRSETIYRAIRFYLAHAPVVTAEEEDRIPEPKRRK